jgi:acetolactate synthase I/II/III large subunit
MATKRIAVESTAEAYLTLLKARGVDYFFGNGGTDFAPIVEAYAKLAAEGKSYPRPITVPHEFTAVSMAHGYAMVAGRPQVVMVHVIVGTANGLGAVMNAARSNVPMLFSAGRTPIAEADILGARNRQIHWAQESFDQGGIVREFVKWDYELRTFAQLETVVDRALSLSTAEPQGPVYLSLPREVLAERQREFEYAEPARTPPAARIAPDPAAVSEAARILAAARNPLVIAKASGRDTASVASLVALAEALGAPVVENFNTYLNFPQDHPLHLGYDTGPFLEAADAILVLESDSPWFPQLKRPSQEARVIHLGVDPMYSRIPIRGFPVDVALVGTPGLALAALAQGVREAAPDAAAARARRERWAAEHRKMRDAWAARARAVQGARPMDMAWVSRCLGDAIDDETIVVNEYDLDPTQACFRRPGSFFGPPSAAGLGWGLGAAMGAKLAAPEKTVVAALGDGAYIFGAPTAAHFTARAFGIPFLAVVFNNQAWNAVKRATADVHPDGWAVRTRNMPISDLDPSPAFELVAQACGAHAERVEDPAALPDALRRALKVVREERRQALLNVICRKP